MNDLRHRIARILLGRLDGPEAGALADADAILAEVSLEVALNAKPQGCICPATAEQTCGGLMCPRRPPRGMVRGPTTING